MHRSLRGRLLAAALFASAAPFAQTVPAYAQVSVGISFDSFHDQLAQHGSWLYSDRWGTVWQPGDVPDDFRPYQTGGHWEYTDDYGWMWVSDYRWGDVAFHYGRWVYDPDEGWLWMPGYVWSPAWVVWRGNNDYLGWMPMPPDDDFLYGRADIGGPARWDDPDRYYSDWYGPRFGGPSLWVFVNYGHIGDRDYRRYAVPPAQTTVLVRQTTNITNYTVVNNYVVNKSIDLHRVEHFAGHPIRPVAARSVIRNPNLIATVSHGNEIRAQMLHVAPRGLGRQGSAPPPPPAIVNKLSDHAARYGSRPGAPQHLFTKSSLTQPDAAAHFHGAGRPAEPGTGPANPPRQNRMDSRPQREMDFRDTQHASRPVPPPDTEPSNVPHQERNTRPTKLKPPPDTEPSNVPREPSEQPPQLHRDQRSAAPRFETPPEAQHRPDSAPANGPRAIDRRAPENRMGPGPHAIDGPAVHGPQGGPPRGERPPGKGEGPKNPEEKHPPKEDRAHPPPQ